ncbi:MAG: transposase [bacterium]
MFTLHRNSPKRIYLDNAIYFVTTKTKYNVPFFKDPVLTNIFIEKLEVAKHITSFLLLAYVILPDHLHLLVQPNKNITISTVMHCIKRNASRSLNIIHPTLVGEDDHPRLRRFEWQSSFYDHIIRNERDFNNHVNYIHFNPVKHGYANKPEDWPWSSYHTFTNEDYGLIDPR